MARFFYIFILFIIAVKFSTCLTSNTKYLKPDETYTFTPSDEIFLKSELRIYCYNRTVKTISNIFQTINIKLTAKDDDYSLYEGPNPEIVQSNYENEISLWNLFIYNNKKQFNVNPYNDTCIGINTAQQYTVNLDIIRIDFRKLTLLLIGLIIFFLSELFSQTPLFYYLIGIIVGILTSFLILIYFASKLFPKKPIMYGVMVGGWGIGLYAAQLIWDNLQAILVTHQTYVFWYIMITGFISFIICYRFGVPEHQKSKDAIKFSLQFVALILIFYSSQFREASFSICVVIMGYEYFPRKSLKRIYDFIRYKFAPPKHKYLTSAEYYEQGIRETSKALEELKRFCNSPDGKPWKTMSKLKDPRRFASFMEGSSHLLDSEILDYDLITKIDDSCSSDDDNAMDDNDSEIDLENEDQIISPSTSNRLVPMYTNTSKHGLITTRFEKNFSSSTPTTRNSRGLQSTRENHDAEISEDDDDS